MLLLGIIATLFGAFVLAIILWLLCAFSGRLVNPNFRMTALQHCVMCLTVAIPTTVLLIVVLSCSIANKMVAQAEASIDRIFMVDDEMLHKIDRKSPSTNAEVLTDYLTQKLAESISSKYPMLERYVNTTCLIEKLNITSQLSWKLSGILEGVDVEDIVKTLQLAKTAVSSLIEDIRSKINSAQRMALIIIMLLQAIAFGAVSCRAFKTRSPDARL